MDPIPSQPGFNQTSSNTPSQNEDLIQQSKEKARDIVASSLNQQQSRPPSTKSTVPGPSRPDSRGHKRSRSGSLKPGGSPNKDAASKDTQSAPTDPHLRQYVYRDQLSGLAQDEQEDAEKDLISQMQNELDMWTQARRSNRLDPGWIYGDGFQGYGNGWTAEHPNTLPHIIYPSHHKRPGRRKTRQLRYPRIVRDKLKEKADELVPVRLDLEIDKLRLRDTFTWNFNDDIVPRKMFAEGLVEDFQIPEDHRRLFIEQVFQSMDDQINEHHPYPFMEESSLHPHLPYFSYKNEDLRILVKLNITIGIHSLVDQFEWDINSPANSPEDFAKKMAADLCLSGEFMTAIAHSIREQTDTFTKALYIAGHPFDGRPVVDLDVRDNMQPSPLPNVFRAYQQARDFTPFFFELNEADLERAEDAFSREQRQQKRAVNRKGGPTLPDLKERLRTVRTMLVSSVVPGAADSLDDCGLYKPTRRTARGRKQYRIDDEGSEISGSDDESVRLSPNIQGPSRARRGAASAAQAAMRAAQPSSLTPEPQQFRTKKFGWAYETNPMTGAQGLILKVKVPRTKYREVVREQKRAAAARQQHGTPHRTHDGSMPPPVHGRQPIPEQGSHIRAPSNGPVGRASHPDNTPPPSRSNAIAYAPQGSQPPPPQWLINALQKLADEHPDESFTGAMRWNHKEDIWQPRIRCNDCANNIMYKTDEEEPIKNFLMHFGNQDHQKKVREKKALEGR